MPLGRTTDESPAATPVDRYWGYLEQVGLGAFVAALVILVGLGIAKLAGANPAESWILEATALIGLGMLILVASTIRRGRSRQLRRPSHRVTGPQARPDGPEVAQPAPVVTVEPAPPVPAPPVPAPPVPAPPVPAAVPAKVTWVCHADASTPGVVLFVLAPSIAGPDGAGAPGAAPPPVPVARGLGPVACFVADPAGAGQRADDHSISRARGVFTVRWHPSFFPGVPEPVSGEYRYRWDELRGDKWQLLASGSVWVDYRPLEEPEIPAPEAGGSSGQL